jgi:hypothetical protein
VRRVISLRRLRFAAEEKTQADHAAHEHKKNNDRDSGGMMDHANLREIVPVNERELFASAQSHINAGQKKRGKNESQAVPQREIHSGDWDRHGLAPERAEPDEAAVQSEINEEQHQPVTSVPRVRFDVMVFVQRVGVRHAQLSRQAVEDRNLEAKRYPIFTRRTSETLRRHELACMAI